MNLELETWEVINSYFRDIPNYLVRHHIDSYNDFINNKIPLIMKNFAKNPPYVLIDKEDRNITYEIKVYYGGKTHDRYKITKPTIINYPSGDVRQLFPNEARLKDLTYGADFFYDIDVEFTMKKGDEVILDKVPSPHTHILKNIYLGKIPIMLKSDLCVLSTASGQLLTQMGEDKYDLGGYFILDGAEKVIVSQERKAENIIFLNTVPQSSGSEKYTHFAEVKCVSDEAFANARTVKVQLERASGAITVRLGQERPLLKENAGRDVPLFIMFRALGIETDKQILQYIIGDLEGELADKMMDLLRPSILDQFILEEEIYDRERAEAYLVKLPSRAQVEKKDGFSDITKKKKTLLSFLYSTFEETFFPHIPNITGNVNNAKAYYLGYMTRKLLLHRLGLVKDTDRDNFINKRIDLSGFLMATLFRSAFEQVIRAVRVETNRQYTFNAKDYSGADKIVDIINETNFNKIFNRDVFKTHFNGALKKGTIGQKVGVVQALDRITRNLTIAHLRRIIDNVGGGKVSIARRRLHATQYGCVCPAETPEGQKVGLNKGLAIISHITFGCQTKPIIDFIIKEGVEVLDDLTPIEVQQLCKVFVNGNWVGCHRNPEYLDTIFRLYRRNGLINIFTSISWECSTNEIIIFADGGRFVRPLYIIENNDILLQPRHIRDIKEKHLSFTDLVSGFRKRTEAYDYYNNDIKELSSIGLTYQDDMYIDKLRESQAVIEYIDSQEFDTTLVSLSFNIPTDSLQRYTHVELHPSMFLSFNAHLLPFTEHNASGRVIFSSKHVKQGISTYAMNFNSRIDTSAHLLNYPQRPFTQGRLYNAITNDKFGQGQNIFVALASYNYNQEDAIVGNQGAIDMGLFHTSYYKMYSDHEMTDAKTGEENHFYNPVYNSEMPHYPDELVPSKRYNYDKVDKYGLPKKGVFLEPDDIVIGKYMKGKDERGADSFRDMSTTTKLGNEGSFVDAVYTWQSNVNGDRAVKIRTCQNRPPVMGDKFASRCAQKGTFGITMRKEDLPYTEDGIIPDIVLDPGSYPKRMTVAQFIEILFGNLGAELGFMGCYNAFEIVNVEQINDILENKLGLTSWGDRVLYNGQTGEQMDVKVFSGVIHYQRLKYMVDDKINTRLTGHRENGIPVPGGLYTVKERQSVAGRANGGGLKFGEMERDALVAHGIWGFIKESYIERCDKFIIQVSKASGEITISNPEIDLYYDNITDGNTSYQLIEGVGSKGLTADRIIGLNTYNQKTTDFIQLVVPYTFKLLVQEMQGMCISVRFDVSRLRQIIPDVDNGRIQEIDDEDIDELMDTEASEFVFDNMDDDIEQDGGGDDTDDDTNDTTSKGNDDNHSNPDNSEIEDTESVDIESSESKSITESESSAMANSPSIQQNNPNLNPNLNPNPNPNDRPQLNADIMPQQSNTGNTSTSTMQSNVPMMQNNSNTMSGIMQPNNMPNSMPSNMPNMEVNHTIGGGSDIGMEEIDLSAYGGVKPDFDIKQRDDDKAIENLNAQLFGLQTGGNNDKLEQAKAMGINQLIQPSIQQSNMQPTMQQPMQQLNTQSTMQPSMQNSGQGLNFSFNSNQPVNPNLNNMQGGMQGGNLDNQKNVSFNSNIKVVELDTKISDGFMYSGSKNLDPFDSV